MSTFKIPPVYAEALFRCLDATSVVDGLKVEDVLRRFRWKFEGGKFGVRSEALAAGVVEETGTSETTLPEGWTKDIAARMEEAAERDATWEKGDDLPVYPPLKEILRVRQAQRKTGPREAAAWSAIFAYCAEDSREIESGMTAVYSAAKRILDDVHYKRGFSGAMTKFSATSDAALDMTIGGGCGAELSLTHLKANALTAHRMMETYRVPYLNVAEGRCKGLLAMMGSTRADDDMDDLADEIEMFLDFEGEVDDIDFPDFLMRERSVGMARFIIFPRAAVFRTTATSYLLSMSDWRKLIILITGFRNYVVGCCADASTGGPLKVAAASRAVSAVYMNFRDAVEIGSKTENAGHLDIAKTYKAMLSVVKAANAGDRAAKHRAELQSDMRETVTYSKHRRVIDENLDRLTGLNPKGALAAAKLFRLLPPPDVWMARALWKRWEKASIVHTLRDDILDEFEEALTEVILTAMANAKPSTLELKTPARPPSWWGAYKTGEIDKVVKSELAEAIKWEGKVKLVARSRFDPSTWKDSALGLDTMKQAMDDFVDKDLRNMLARMLFDPDCPMPEDTAEIVEEISAVMLKPESHKERIAYMNNLRSRLRQSLTEATVSAVMKDHPSFAPVKSGVEKDAAFEELAAPPPSTRDVPMAKAFSGSHWVTVYYSFDITGWSENMPLSIQVRSHKVWDKFTGGAEFSDTTSNHHRSKVYMNNGGVKAWYTNGGANFEGYNGKEMTALHIAILTMAVRNLRNKCPDIPASMLRINLQAYIDDGIAKMTLPSNVCERAFEQWEEAVVETWARFGFTVEPKKSFPSYHYFEFLGEEFYAGRQLSSGSKAAMRITAEPFEYWETLPERVSKICSACRGAATAGMDPIGAIIVQNLFVAQEVANWVPVKDATAVAFWCLTPRGLGGVGVPCLVPQAENAVGAILEEGLAGLHAWAISGTNPAVELAYDKICLRGFTTRTSSSVLSSPLGGTSPEGVMRLSYIADVARKGLKKLSEKGALSPTAKALIDLSCPTSEEEFAEAVFPLVEGDVMQEAVVKDVADGSLEKISDAFLSRFEKESTFLRVSSRSALRRVRRNAQIEAEESFLISARLVLGASAESVATRKKNHRRYR